MAVNVTYEVTNPPDGITTYTHIRIETADDSGGSPGAFSLLTTVSVDTTQEITAYSTTAADNTDWFRHRYENATTAAYSDYSASLQVGDYLVRQWIKSDITDTTITNAMWNQWRDQAFLDMQLRHFSIPADIQSITPSSYTDEWEQLDFAIDTVTAVEIYDTSGYYICSTDDWDQRGSQVRIYHPDTDLRYKVYGTKELKSISDILEADETMQILFWLMKSNYYQKKIDERMDFKYWLSADKTSDVSADQLLRMKEHCIAEAERRMVNAMGRQEIRGNSR